MVEIITGRINDFKTTTMKKRFEKDRKGDGFISLKQMEKDTVMGYDAMRLSSGEKRPLVRNEAYFKDDFVVRDRIGPYLFNAATMDWIESEVDRLIEARISPIYFDEVGMLELAGRGFSSMLKRMAASDLDLILVIRRDLVDRIVTVFELDIGN
ncbi:MAG: nucleoside-triphosphatase [Acholeplasmataceae bacterium]